MSNFALIIALGGSLGLCFLKSKTVEGRLIYFFRAFFPSWKFFNQVKEAPELIGANLPKPLKRSFWTLFHNPKGADRILFYSMLEQWQEHDSHLGKTWVRNWLCDQEKFHE